MDELKKVIDLQPLSDENIALHKYALSDLWMVKDENNKVFGPYPTDELREYSRKYKYLFDAVKVYNLETEAWYDIFDVKHFQRRKPKLVSAQNLIADSNFYVLVNGQKKGPFTLQKMQQLLNTGSILPNSQISLDSGHSWIKLYEHHAFDRRSKKKNQDLPFIPDQKILTEQGSIESHSYDEDAIIELAQLNLKSVDKNSPTSSKKSVGIKTKTQIMKNPLILEDNIKEVEKEKPEWLSRFAVVTASLAIVTGLFFVGNYFFKDLNKSAPPALTTKTDVKSIDNSERVIPKKPKREPASIRKSAVKRIKRVKAKRYVPKAKPSRMVQRFNERRIDDRRADEDPLDINDPLVQDELTRKLAGEEEQEDPYDDGYSNEYDEPDREAERLEDDYPAEESYIEDRVPEDPYGQADEGRDEYQYDAPYDE